jgi:excinuclease ABC subunit C
MKGGLATPSFNFQPGQYPERPGCYIMKNDSGRILYVGKSKQLRSRLRSYFRAPHPHKRIRQLVEEIADIEIILVNNEPESLILENNLIKIHKPPYNRALKKDNSGYAYLKLTAEQFPRLDVFYRDRRLKEGNVRLRGRSDASEVPKGGEVRFGPYLSSRFRNEVMEFITDHYKLRTCTNLPKRACLLYHIGRCSGVCEGMITEQDYLDTVNQAASLLANRGEKLVEAMYRQIELYAERLEFEKAENMLRHIRVLERREAKQVVDREITFDQDVLYFGEHGVLVAKMQEGMLRDFTFHQLPEFADEPSCDRFLTDYYRESRPDEIIVSRIHDAKAVRAALRRNGRVPITITQPKRGLKHDLLQLCRENYEYRTRGITGPDLSRVES